MSSKPKAARGPLILVAIVSLLVGGGIGYAAGHSNKDKKGSAAATGPATTVATNVPTDTIPTDIPSFSEAATTPDLLPSDFRISLKIKQKECFGSAGCNITYRIDPTYIGAEDIDNGSWDVTYVVRGGEDGPQVNTFTLEDGQASFDSEELISTPSSSTKLRVSVTRVDANN